MASVGLTAFSTLFHLFAMRRGLLVVGDGAGSLVEDLKRMPRVAYEFFAVVPRAILRTNTADPA
jgi:hypothetical protein